MSELSNAFIKNVNHVDQTRGSQYVDDDLPDNRKARVGQTHGMIESEREIERERTRERERERLAVFLLALKLRRNLNIAIKHWSKDYRRLVRKASQRQF